MRAEGSNEETMAAMDVAAALVMAAMAMAVATEAGTTMQKQQRQWWGHWW